MSFLDKVGTAVVALVFLLTAGSSFAAAQPGPADQHIAYYQRLLQRNAKNSRAYLGLGDALIRKARETGDPSYFDRAEQALKKSLELAPQNAGAMRHLAYVYYSRHEFAEATVYSRKAVTMNPRDSDSYGVLGDALMEVGEYDQAAEVYQKMMELDQSLYSYSRLAGLKTMRGDTAGAENDLQLAIAAGKSADRPAESIAWAEWQLGSDYFATGDLAKAETFYKHSLDTYPKYYRALAGMAQLRASQKKYNEAIDFYRQAIAILPMPEYIAALGDIYQKIGKPDEARKQYRLVEYVGKLSALNKMLYNRELAYFYADHDLKLNEALELARRELEYRNDIYAYDLLAWSLYKSGQLEKAREAITQALRLNTKDARLFYHAGMIYHRLGDMKKAGNYLRRALQTNPYFHISFAENAERTLKKLERTVEPLAVQSPGGDS